MHHSAGLAAALGITCLVASTSTALAGNVSVPDALVEQASSGGYVRVIVTLHPPQSPAEGVVPPTARDQALKRAAAAAQAAVINRLPARALARAPKRFPFTAQFGVSVTAAGLAALAADPDVAAIEEDVAVPPLLDQSVPHVFPSADSSTYSGAGWAVAVLDTGVDKNHSFLAGKVISEACYSTTDSANYSTTVCPGGVEESIAPGSGLPCSPSISGCDHGTHVAGIAAGSGTSFHGVAKDGSLIAVQVFSVFTNPTCANVGISSPCLLSYTSDQILGLQRVYELRSAFNVAAVNMSLGGGRFSGFCDSDSRKPTVDLLRGAGIATVIASGNNGWSDSVSAPGCISTAITVGSSSLSDVRSFFSNSGPQLDLYAPGESIDSSVLGGAFALKSGTSMATPHVAGAWAVARQKYPTNTVDEIEDLFKGSGVTITVGGVSAQRIDVDGVLGGNGGGGDGHALVTLSPCRIADTRLAGGKLTAGETRHLIVRDASATQSQGGAADCGVPPDARAVVLNITATGMATGGHFRVFPFAAPLPTASILNYQATTNVANSTTVPICQPLCDKDISVYSTQAAHLVVDVMGYFQ